MAEGLAKIRPLFLVWDRVETLKLQWNWPSNHW